MAPSLFAFHQAYACITGFFRYVPPGLFRTPEFYKNFVSESYLDSPGLNILLKLFGFFRYNPSIHSCPLAKRSSFFFLLLEVVYLFWQDEK